ncbi:hypothetical protein NEF87_002127 [Candidatus Lokiarchaeum ossiferum]|uniref:YtxH domain-containing protein n=1 Tax=Candidatus Lokiarchaeum ossiferum TaxID=2951803 RepID=A0ABY6HQS2_9ARCH|nr:hypothetical protein NEF87_002127 [Candidatus Lokiarchaeum sp. B-35]
MGDTKKKIKDTFDTVKSGTKTLKNATKSVTLVKKGIGTGIKILDEIAPEAGQKVHDVMDSVQRKLEDHEGDIENAVNKLQSGLDRVVGDRIETAVEKLENKIDEKGGKKIEAKFEEVVEKVETVVSPFIQKGKKIATDGSKDVIKKVIEKNLK